MKKAMIIVGILAIVIGGGLFVKWLMSPAAGVDEPVNSTPTVAPVEQEEEAPMSFDERVGILKNMIGNPTEFTFIETVMSGIRPVESTDNSYIFLASELEEKDNSMVTVKFNADKTVIEEIEVTSAKDGEVPKIETFN